METTIRCARRLDSGAGFRGVEGGYANHRQCEMVLPEPPAQQVVLIVSQAENRERPLGRLLTGLLIVAGFHAGYCVAEVDYETIVRNNIATVDANRDTWAYRIELTDSEFTRVIDYDPSLESSRRWQLISVDGEPPTQAQLQEHRERWAKDDADSTGQEMRKEYSLGDIIDLDSLTPQSETENHYVVSFQPTIKDLKDESGKLNGTLYINKKTERLDFLSITNERNLSPAFSVSIEDFNLYFSFAVVQDTLFPKVVTTDIEGTALFFKSFERNSSQKYSDFRFVGDSDGLSRSPEP